MTGRQRSTLLAVASAAAAVDLLVKTAAERWLTDPHAVAGVLTLRVTHNPGVAFGLGADLPPWLVLGVTGAAVVGLLVAALRGLLAGVVPAGLIVGGGLANLADRIHGGTVTDVLDLGWFPVFNPADVFVTVGVAWLLIYALRSDRDEQRRSGDEHPKGERECV